MIKYIDADLLRKEINRRIEFLKNAELDWSKQGDIETSVYYIGKSFALDELTDFIDSLQQGQPDENLDEAARNYGVRGNANGVGGEDYANDLEIAFKAGAYWQKSQMLKDVIEADVNTYKDPVLSCGWAEFVVDMPSSETDKLGDKVRIIIVKED